MAAFDTSFSDDVSIGRSKATRTSRGPCAQANTGCGRSGAVYDTLNSLPLPSGPLPQSGPPLWAATTKSPFGDTHTSQASMFVEAKSCVWPTYPAGVGTSLVRYSLP